ncbi:hypothetical protein ACFL1J_03265 [Pseudomonadota bacterium]
MHRSGTSCISGMLQAAGFFSDIIDEWSPDNTKGSRENSAIVILNDSLLRKGGGSWRQTDFSLSPSLRHKERRNEILKTLTSAQRPWMFKDPRTLLTLPFWLEALPDIKMLGIFRHPMAVAKSLSTRNSMPVLEGLHLWRVYNQKLLEIRDLNETPLLCFSDDLNGLIEPAHFIVKKYFSEQVAAGILQLERMQVFLSTDLVHQKQPANNNLLDTLVREGMTGNEAETLESIWESLMSHALNKPWQNSDSKLASASSDNNEQNPLSLSTADADISLDDVLHQIDLILSENPSRVDLWQKGLRLIKRDGNPDQLSSWVLKGLNILPDDPFPIFEKAKIAWQSGEEEEALVMLKSATKLAPGWAPALNLLSKWHYERQEWQEAAQALTELSSRSQLEPIPLNFIQLFLDTGRGYSEKESIKLPVIANTKSQFFEFDFHSFKNIIKLRFDPINDFAVVKLEELRVFDAQHEELTINQKANNAQAVENETYFFNVRDSQLHLELSQKDNRPPCKLTARLQYLHTGTSALLKCLELIKHQIVHVNQTNKRGSDMMIAEPPIETKPFLVGWKLEGIDQIENSDTKVFIKGLLLPKNGQTLHIALRYDGLIRSYPLNVSRSGLIHAFADQNLDLAQNSCFGFKYSVPVSTTIEIGIEHDMRLYWIDTVQT